MPLDAGALERSCGGVLRRHAALPARTRPFPATRSRPARRSPSAARRKRRCSARSRLRWAGDADRLRQHPRERRLVERGVRGRPEDGGAARRRRGAARPPAPLVSFESAGVALVYGRDETAIEAARRLADHLDITVLLTQPGDVAPPRATAFPVLQGTIAAPRGHLGAFELRIDDYAAARALLARQARVRSRAATARPRPATSSSTCRAALPLFPAHELRSGYLRADPRDPAAVERAMFEASHLVGTFDKPRYVNFHRASLRPLPLADHRLHALSRAVPDRSHRARRRPCGDRPVCLRRLRQLRRGLPDRRRRLRAAVRRRAAAHAAHAAARLPRSGGQRCRSCCSMTASMASR